MDFQKHRKMDTRTDVAHGLSTFEMFIKIATFVVLLAVGLKLTFWAVGIVDELVHRPDQIAILRPLIEKGDGTSVRSLQIDATDSGILIQDRDALSIVVIVLFVAVLFGAIGRAIAALIGGAIKLLTSIDFGRGKKGADKGAG
jgi:hypothetical protein